MRCTGLAWVVCWLAAVGLVGCARDADPLPRSGEGRILEMRRLTGQNPFARDVYACATCTLEQFEAIVVPAGWEKGSPKRSVPDIELLSKPVVPGVAVSIDYVAELPGNEFEFIAQVIDGNVVASDMGVAAVARATRFRYPAGSVVHEVSDDGGHVYLLFAVAEELFADMAFSLNDPAAFAGMPLPAGWSYASRTLDAPLEVDSEGLAQVLAHSRLTSWQRYLPAGP
jgi:hypothetical protein